MPPANNFSALIETTLLSLAEQRQEKTFCPSEVARAVSDNWRELMPLVREVAAKLVQAGKLRCTRGGEVCDPLSPGGPIRLSRPAG